MPLFIARRRTAPTAMASTKDGSRGKTTLVKVAALITAGTANTATPRSAMAATETGMNTGTYSGKGSRPATTTATVEMRAMDIHHAALFTAGTEHLSTAAAPPCTVPRPETLASGMAWNRASETHAIARRSIRFARADIATATTTTTVATDRVRSTNANIEARFSGDTSRDTESGGTDEDG